MVGWWKLLRINSVHRSLLTMVSMSHNPLILMLVRFDILLSVEKPGERSQVPAMAQYIYGILYGEDMIPKLSRDPYCHDHYQHLGSRVPVLPMRNTCVLGINLLFEECFDISRAKNHD